MLDEYIGRYCCGICTEMQRSGDQVLKSRVVSVLLFIKMRTKSEIDSDFIHTSTRTENDNKFFREGIFNSPQFVRTVQSLSHQANPGSGKVFIPH